MNIDINKKYRTRDGREVRILCTDLDDSRQPVVAFIKGDAKVTYYTKEGCWSSPHSKSPEDLIEIREPRQWTIRFFNNGKPGIWGGPNGEPDQTITVREVLQDEA